jgi:hypothetical protein
MTVIREFARWLRTQHDLSHRIDPLLFYKSATSSRAWPRLLRGAFLIPPALLVVEQVNSVGGVNGKMLELVIYDDQALATSKAP